MALSLTSSPWYRLILHFVGLGSQSQRGNGPFAAAERSRGTKSPNWRANDALGHVKKRKFKFGGIVKYVPVRHLLSSLAIVPRDRSAAAKGPLVQLARSRRLPCNKGSQQMEAQMLRK